MSNHQSNDTKVRIVRFFWDGPAPDSGKRRLSIADIADFMKDSQLTPTKNVDTEEEMELDADFLD